MPPKAKVTKADILQAAADIVRLDGVEQLNARAVAQKLGVSTQPIFSNYACMDELLCDVISYGEKLYYNSYMQPAMLGDKYPKYKASGMSYIEFAKREKELFKLLYMRDRTKEKPPADWGDFSGIIDIVQKNVGIDRDRAEFFHLEMWTFVHGIAVMMATSYLELDMDTVSGMISDVYQGLVWKFAGKDITKEVLR
ncbi:MAG: TetR/AcrR family transcriptional regulator [Ruminococcaceae bacterium]|nr:TetR/AcrR family transcriptional regulator [Oscillospiraceae bacterium]